VHETFRQIYGVAPKFEAPSYSKSLDITGDISGIIGLVQDMLEGSLILSFEKETILKIVEKIYQQKFTEINKSVSGTVCELCNITYGVLKKFLNERGHNFKMSLPHVIIGDEHSLQNNQIGPVVELVATIDGLKFKVIVVLNKGN